MKYVVYFLIIFVFVSCNYSKTVKSVVFPKVKANLDEDSVSFIFVGDIMGHMPFINSAFVDSLGHYDFTPVFSKVSPFFKSVDFTVGNLEVTLGGEPYSGYPRFSSPDELAFSCKKSGINVLMTANNHTCDRGRKGILRTLNVLDSAKISHTGSFKDSSGWSKNNLLILEKHNIRVGVLNYTYGTNGLPVPKGTIVNIIDTNLIKQDILRSKEGKIDKLIVFLHWGRQYKSHPSKSQKKTADFLHKNGVDIVIGSHPHVIQKMKYKKGLNNKSKKLVVYSLGNFISNQREVSRDGGLMVKITIRKRENLTSILTPSYYLTWVNKFRNNRGNNYEILPCFMYEKNGIKISRNAQSKMSRFIKNSRVLLNKENSSFVEQLN
tara:strand:- start:21 stop:1157 length:1137 start_codon:yes stop_codon:yes gene_type:complete